MPGYNHRNNCTCGWCSGGNRSVWSYDSSLYDLSSTSSKTQDFSVEETEAKTYLINCWWCNQSVFYHTNGNGDSVLFDSLGWPWKVHLCWENYANDNKRSFNIYHQSFPKPSNYFTQILNSVEVSSSINKSNNIYKILVGAAISLENIRTSNLALFGIKEIELCQFMNLSLEYFRNIYGQFYIKYTDNDVSIKTIYGIDFYNKIKEKTLSEKKNLFILEVNKAPELKFGQFGAYGLTENMLAKRMGLTLKDLRLYFGEIYSVYSSGNIILTVSHK